MRILGLVCWILVFCSPPPNEAVSAGIRSLTAPTYPHVARTASISGEVHLRARISEEGRVASVDGLSGPPILVEYSRKNLLTWTFMPSDKGAEVEVVFSYELRPPHVYYDPIPAVVINSPTHVTITSNLPEPSGYPEPIKRKDRHLHPP